MGIPLAALAVQQPPSVLDQVSKIAALKSAMMNQQFQQQLQPIELQQAQQQQQSGAVDLQMKQLGLKNAQTAQDALRDPNFEQNFKDWQNSKQSSSATATQPGTAGLAGGALQLHPIAQYLAEKKGLPLFGPEGAMEISSALTGSAEKMAELSKTQGQAGTAALENHSKQLENLYNLAQPILTETDPAKQQQQIANLQSEIQAHPDLYPVEATRHLDKLGTVQAVQFAANTSKVRQMIVDDATKQAEASKATLAATAPTSQQIAGATRTIATYGAIPQNMRAGLIGEMQSAPNYETLQKIQARADAANESFQRSADARTQANAMKDLGQKNLALDKMLKEDQSLGKSMDETGAIRDALDLSKGGNQQATAAAQQLMAEHIVRQGGINRFNELEQRGLVGNMGSWGRQFKSWLEKGGEGAMPQATNQEMQALLDAEDKAAQLTHDRNIGYITDRVLGKNTGATPASPGNGSAPSPGAPVKSPPPQATHIVPGPDGRRHYTNAQGTVDYGIAP
jgi:hypothetical protein